MATDAPVSSGWRRVEALAREYSRRAAPRRRPFSQEPTGHQRTVYRPPGPALDAAERVSHVPAGPGTTDPTPTTAPDRPEQRTGPRPRSAGETLNYRYLRTGSPAVPGDHRAASVARMQRSGIRGDGASGFPYCAALHAGYHAGAAPLRGSRLRPAIIAQPRLRSRQRAQPPNTLARNATSSPMRTSRIAGRPSRTAATARPTAARICAGSSTFSP